MAIEMDRRTVAAGWSLSNRANVPIPSPRKGMPPPPPILHHSSSDASNYGNVVTPQSSYSSNMMSMPSAPSAPPPQHNLASRTSSRQIILEAEKNAPTTFKTMQEPNDPPAASLVQLYYSFFHSSHPIVLPPHWLLDRTRREKIPQLTIVMQWLGSRYAQRAPSDIKRVQAEQILVQQNLPRSPWTVQALLLFAIGLHCCNEQEYSMQILGRAIDMALELGMNEAQFAINHSDGCRVTAESWRRTWWELYVLDGLMAGVHQRSSFRLLSVQTNVPLPCEESQYVTGRIPYSPKSVEEFDNRHFADGPTPEFSSYTYRIEAIRVLGKVLQAGQDTDSSDPLVDAADASLVNWGLHLPDSKKELVGRDMKVDEMLFQAHMIINAATIFLHRPRSSLAFSPVPDDTTCTPPRQISQPLKPMAFHTTKAIRAADTISKLITLPTPLIKHTPWFTCVITLGAIVHLSACCFVLAGEDAFVSKERIRLGVGALKTMEEIWPVAGCVLQQVKGVAREVFAIRARSPPDSMGGGGRALMGGSGGFAREERPDVLTEEDVMRLIDDETLFDGLGESDYLGLPGLEWDGSDEGMGSGLGSGSAVQE